MKIAVVIPVYNEINSIESLIKRILADENDNLSIDIYPVDGGSTDGTSELLQKLSSSSDKIHYLHNPGKIAPAAMNIGIKEALKTDCDLIQIFNAHSKTSENYFGALTQAAEKHPEISVFSPQCGFVPSQSVFEKAVQLFSLSPLGRNWQKVHNIQQPVKGYAHGAFAARKEVFEKVGFFNEEFIRNQDNDYLTRIEKAGFDLYTMPGITILYTPRRDFGKLLRQNYQFGMYLVLNASHHSYKQKAPFVFYLLLLILLFAMNAGLFFDSYYLTRYSLMAFTFVTTFYLYAIILEGLRNFFRSGFAGLLLPFILIPVHFFYAMGTFSGIIFGVDKDI